MKRINLMWYGPYSVVKLSEKLNQHVFFFEQEYFPLEKYGFYMYLDQDLSQAIYMGQASGKGRSLRNRIRYEVLKDSKVSENLQKSGIDKFSLKLKVSHIIKATDNEILIEFIPVSLLNNIENALICELKPLINRRGKKRYHGESIEIFNDGNFAPLPEMIKKVTGEGQ